MKRSIQLVMVVVGSVAAGALLYRFNLAQRLFPATSVLAYPKASAELPQERSGAFSKPHSTEERSPVAATAPTTSARSLETRPSGSSTEQRVLPKEDGRFAAASQRSGKTFRRRLESRKGAVRLATIVPGQYGMTSERLSELRKLAEAVGVDPNSVVYTPADTESPSDNALHKTQGLWGEHWERAWVTAMEGSLKQRFSEQELTKAGLGGLELTDVECRAGTCRLEIEYPDSLVVALDDQGKSVPGGAAEQTVSPERPSRVVEHFISGSSPLGPDMRTVSETSSFHKSGRKHKETRVVSFSDEEIDPKPSSCGVIADIKVREPERILPQTPLKNEQGMRRFLEEHGAGFNAMRRALLPQIREAIGSARDCFDQMAESGAANVTLTLHLASTEREAEVSSIRAIDIEGFGQGERMAMECLQRYVLGRSFRVTAEVADFAPYNGIYPNLIPEPFYRRIDRHAGSVSISDDGDKVTLFNPK